MVSKDHHRPPPRYMICRAEKAGFVDILSLMFLRKPLASYSFIETGSMVDEQDVRSDWITGLTLLVQKILLAISKPMNWAGHAVEFFLNLLALNGGILRLILHAITGSVVIPNRDAANFRSMIAHIDNRKDLYNYKMNSNLINYFPIVDSQAKHFGDINILDLSTMAAKIAYENAAYIEDVVTNHWKMYFVGFYSCWNKFLEEKTTQAFIFCNKEEDAELIMVAFRGTEPFNTRDWSTDIDLSWLSMGKMGKVHMGFLKALGLQDDKDYNAGFPKDSPPDDDDDDDRGPLAYYAIRDELATLLTTKHKGAKIVFTGHSLGAALAAIFPSLLSMHGRSDILGSMYGVLNYGQPRVGDAVFGSYMAATTWYAYYRMVYRSDIVPRIPFDLPPASLFKHFGTCIYYNGWYEGVVMEDDAPNPNYFDPKYVVPMYYAAWADLFKAMFIIGKTAGADFKEGYVSILYRATGLIFPGIACHSPRDYVNGGRLAKVATHNHKVIV